MVSAATELRARKIVVAIARRASRVDVTGLALRDLCGDLSVALASALAGDGPWTAATAADAAAGAAEVLAAAAAALAGGGFLVVTAAETVAIMSAARARRVDVALDLVLDAVSTRWPGLDGIGAAAISAAAATLVADRLWELA